MQAETLDVVDLELLLAQVPQPTILCESLQCQHLKRGEHPAHYTVTFTCGRQRFWCQRRLVERLEADRPFYCTSHHEWCSVAEALPI